MSNRSDPRRPQAESGAESAAALRRALGSRTLILIGLMGCGKTSVGRRLAAALGLPFVDADDAIEQAADMTIPEIFAAHGETYFRDGERRVIARLLRDGQKVLATGGGAFMSEETRTNIAQSGISIWLRAELPVLMKRVMRRDNRPLLKTADPEATMRRLMELRYPIYALADVTVRSREVPHDVIVGELIEAVARHLDGAAAPSHPQPSAEAAMHSGPGDEASTDEHDGPPSP